VLQAVEEEWQRLYRGAENAPNVCLSKSLSLHAFAQMKELAYGNCSGLPGSSMTSSCTASQSWVM
jgi:hypothetical protein